jgi:hypothetical protein
MAQEIGIGMVLIKEGTTLPQGLQVESEPYLKGWSLVRNLNGSALDRRLCDSAWTFFFMAGEIKMTAFGSDLAATTRRAVKKIVAGMKSDHFNCLEISRVEKKKFLGLPFVSVGGHPRHIQESIYLFHTRHIAEWKHEVLPAA